MSEEVITAPTFKREHSDRGQSFEEWLSEA
jgi:hypothetical protein